MKTCVLVAALACASFMVSVQAGPIMGVDFGSETMKVREVVVPRQIRRTSIFHENYKHLRVHQLIYIAGVIS